MNTATPATQTASRMRPQPFTIWNPTRGTWETTQPTSQGVCAVAGDLADLGLSAQ